MLSAMARYDIRDPFCVPDPLHPNGQDWRQLIGGGVYRLKIGVLRRPGLQWSRCGLLPSRP